MKLSQASICTQESGVALKQPAEDYNCLDLYPPPREAAAFVVKSLHGLKAWGPSPALAIKVGKLSFWVSSDNNWNITPLGFALLYIFEYLYFALFEISSGDNGIWFLWRSPGTTRVTVMDDEPQPQILCKFSVVGEKLRRTAGAHPLQCSLWCVKQAPTLMGSLVLYLVSCFNKH